MKIFKVFYSIFYFAILGYIVFFASRRRDREYYHEINLVPIKYSVRTFKMLDNRTHVINFYLNLFGNIVLFIPFSIIAISVFRTPKLIKILTGAFLLSTFIELTQYIFEVGFADVDDIILNTSGALAGFYSFKIFCFRSGRYRSDKGGANK